MDNSVQMIAPSKLRLLEYNPRFIRDDNFRKLQQSILRDPSFMEARPLLVNKTSEGLFVYAGSQRYRACLDLEWTEIPCIIDENLPESVIKSRMVKDNLHHGEWDEDKLVDFNVGDLEFLNLKKMDAIKVDFGGAGDEDMTLREKHNDKAEKDEQTVHGAHVFNVLHENEEGKQEFEILLNNLPKQPNERVEDYLVGLLKKKFND